MPRINKPERHKQSDYMLLNSKTQIDLKTPTGRGKWVVQGQVNNQKNQAKTFIIDISKCGLKENISELCRQTEEVMRRERLSWIERIMIVCDETLIRVYERI